jgi:shikimate dehydrogenase
MYPDSNSALIEDDAFYGLIHTAFDVVYRPMETRFMKKAEAAGAVTIGGLEMLLYQAVEAYELWTGTHVADEVCDKVYEVLVRKRASRKNIVLTGFMGSGKTTVSKALSESTGYRIYDTDAMIEEAYENTVSTIFEKEGEDAFRKMETGVLENILRDLTTDLILSTGG